MRRATFFPVFVAVIAGVALSGCVEQQLLILTNETRAPIRVKYAVPFLRVAPDAPQVCPLPQMTPMVRRPTAREQWLPSGWTEAPGLSLNIETCEADYVVEPGFAALVYRNGFCDDYERYADQGAAFRPSLEYLAVETTHGIEEWRGWDTAEQFKRDRGGWCFLRIVSPDQTSWPRSVFRAARM